jgi:hypothetical protein
LPGSCCNAAGVFAIRPYSRTSPSPAAFGYRHNDPVRVKIKPDLRYTIP